MEQLADTVERKFIESFDIDDYEILTDDGWHDCKSIHKTVQYKVWQLTTKSYQLRCVDTHIVFNEQMQQVFVKDLQIGQYIWTETGLDEVVDVVELDYEDNMYDIELDDESNHRYYTNGILSHNTTTYTIFCMWMAALHPEKKIMICANKLQTSIEIMDRLRLAYEYLPKWLKPGILVYNKQEMTFGNKSTIRAFATSSSASRGFSCQICIIDEMAFIPKNVINEFFASVMPVVSSAKDSKVIVVSTPNGTSGLYYDIWQSAISKEAKNNKEGWKPFRVDWFEVPGRTPEWKEKQIASIGIQRWNQEFGNEFIAASTIKKLIPDDVIERFRMKLSEYKTLGIKPKKQRIISQKQDEIYEFDMWHEFQPTHTYVASGDIAEGIGADSSVLYIWDVTDLSNIIMCAKFSSNTVSLVQFAFICNKILELYNKPFLFAERNGVSAGMIDSLRVTYNYENIASENKRNEYGIYSHVQVKGKACLWAREMLTTKGFGFTLYDKDLIDDMDIFVKKDTKGLNNVYQALPGPGSHDDHIMSLIWLCFALNTERVGKYFVVVEDFTTELQQIYPKRLQPLYEYKLEDVKNIFNNQMYLDYMEFKHDVKNAINTVQTNEKQMHTQQYDIYFNDYDSDSWNSTPFDWNMKQQNVRPASFQNQSSLNQAAPTFFVF